MTWRSDFRRATLVLLLALGGCRGNDVEALRLNGCIETLVVELVPHVAGRVAEVNAGEGVHVKKGDLLLVLDVAESEPSLAKARDRLAFSERGRSGARADVALVKAELDRRDAISTGNEGTSAGDAETRTAMNREAAEIRAPADGVILRRLAEPGQLLAAGQPALTFAPADRLRVRVLIPRAKREVLELGRVAAVSLDALPGRCFPAQVTGFRSGSGRATRPAATSDDPLAQFDYASIELEAVGGVSLAVGQVVAVSLEMLAGPANAANPNSLLPRVIEVGAFR